MDILDSLTSDYDQLRELVTEFTIASSPRREALFKEIVRLQEISGKAESSALVYATQGWTDLEQASRKMLERYDVMEDLAHSIAKTPTQALRDAKMQLFCDLVLQRIQDSEREVLPHLFDVMETADREMSAKIYERYKQVGSATAPGSSLRAV